MAELAKESEPDVIPDGWCSSLQAAERLGWTKQKTDSMLRRRVANGQLQAKKMRGMCNGHVREMVFYGPKP